MAESKPVALCLSQLCQIEIECRDIEKSADFYDKVFGWQALPAEIFGLKLLQTPAALGFGLCLRQSLSQQAAHGARLRLSFAAQDPETIIALASDFGVKVAAKHVIGGYGTVTVIKDLDGHEWGLFEAQQPE